MPALAGVVVDHVQHHLDAGLVQRVDHLDEFGDLQPGHGGKSGIGREVIQRGIAPVILAAAGMQLRLGRAGVHREQFQGGDAQALEVLDDGRVRHPQKLPAQLRGDVRMQPGQPRDVRLVDDGLLPRHPGTHRRRSPRLGDDAERNPAQRLDTVRCRGDQVVVGGGHLPRVRVEQDLRRIPFRHPEPVLLAGFHVGDEGVPDAVGLLVHGDPALGAVRPDQAELDVGDAGDAVGHHREVGAVLVRRRAQRIRQARVGARSEPGRCLRVDLAGTGALGAALLLAGFRLGRAGGHRDGAGIGRVRVGRDRMGEGEVGRPVGSARRVVNVVAGAVGTAGLVGTVVGGADVGGADAGGGEVGCAASHRQIVPDRRARADRRVPVPAATPPPACDSRPRTPADSRPRGARRRCRGAQQ